jgi:cytochrome c oxidase cbb3-type subunit 3
MSADKSNYEADKLLDHDYDGIQEYDNRLPNWWLWILWGTIVFSIGYWLLFHTYGVFDLPAAKYESEMEAAGGALADMESRGLTEGDLLAMSADPAKAAEGEAIWTQYCVVCHKPDGSGLVGPNLTDDYWIHGGAVSDIHNIVVKGVPEKGMASWGRQLGPDRVDAVVSHVLTLRGRNLPGKEPEGDLYAEAPSPEAMSEGEDPESTDMDADAPAGGSAEADEAAVSN